MFSEVAEVGAVRLRVAVEIPDQPAGQLLNGGGAGM
jgi:hypothetical protein